MRNLARSLHDSLTPDVDTHAASFLGRRFLGMPGPVWSLAAWNILMIGFVSFSWLSSGRTNEIVQSNRLLMIGVWVVASAILLVFKGRTPGWFLHLMLDLNIALVCWATATAPSDLRAVTLMFMLVPLAVYPATWFPRAQMAGHLLVLVVFSAVAVMAETESVDWVRVWVVLMTVCVSLAYFVQALVLHLAQQATLDPVTGLMNRAGLAHVTESFERRAANGLPRTIAVIDLDGFKEINDRQGHEAGDAILREVGEVLREHLRPTDAISRLGGDEFVLLLSRIDMDRAQTIVARVVEAFPVPASFGIADWGLDQPFDESLALADAEMYRNKRHRKRSADIA